MYTKTQKVGTLATKNKKSTSNIDTEHSTIYPGVDKHLIKETLVKLGKKHKIKGYADIIIEVQQVVNKWNSFAKELVYLHTLENR